jgi:DNA excision repair protein ERCC-2
MSKIKISITDFAVPVVRKGCLTRDGMVMGMDIGSELHKILQLQRAKILTYKSEVAIGKEFSTKRFTFHISGRADGVYYDQGPLVEEIKSTFSLEYLKKQIEADPYHPYRLQALTYAYLMRQLGNKEAEACLLLVSVKNRKEVIIPLEIDEVYENWFEKRLQQLEDGERLRLSQIRRRMGVAKTLTFPFEKPRLHQDALLEACEGVVADGNSALFQAPTGIGKTIGVLFPTLKNTLSRGCPTIYIAPKNRQFEVAKDAVARLDPKAKAIKTRILTAKRKLCSKERMDCNPDYCEYAKDYYDKMRENKIAAKLMAKDIVGQAEIKEISEQYEVCPYQVQMDTSSDADLLVGDYNYVFSPRAGLADKFKEQKKKDRYSLVIDEAHNLYQRGVEYYSPTLDVSELISISTFEIGDKLSKRFKKLVSDAIDLVESFRPKNGRSGQVELKLSPFENIQERLHQLLIDYFVECDELWDNDPVLEFYGHWANFLEVLQSAGEESKFSYIFDHTREFLKITCCDPSKYLKEIHDEFHSSIAFSATLKPFNFYQTMSGFSENAVQQEFDSGFPAENRKLLVIPQISTTYRNRERNYRSIQEVVKRITKLEKGNYIVFFPSYKFLDSTRQNLDIPGFKILSQERDMKLDDVDSLERSLTNSKKPTIVLAVQGGAFSEGMDLNSPFLKGVFIVGPAIPMVTYERGLLKDYYDSKFGDGTAYAYVYPAMARSVQAAGRVIRSSEKRGLIVMMDSRFIKDPYVETMPGYWMKDSVDELVSNQILKDVSEFWSNSPKIDVFAGQVPH